MRIEFVRCGEQTLSSSSGSTGENDRISKKSERNTKPCDAGTDVPHSARMQLADDVMYHVVRNNDLELDMSVALSVVHMSDKLETMSVIAVSSDGLTNCLKYSSVETRMLVSRSRLGRSFGTCQESSA